MLITLYGINNTGKSTQALRLVARLKEEGHDAEYVKYPVYDLEPTGPYLNQVLRNGGTQSMSEEELQLWFTLNRYQFEPQLKTWLSQGKIVVAEDYTGTGIAWGTLKGASMEWLEAMNQGLTKESLALLIDGERFKEASELGHLHESDDALMERSRRVHLELAQRYGWTVVPLVEGIEQMEERIWDAVRLHLS